MSKKEKIIGIIEEDLKNGPIMSSWYDEADSTLYVIRQDKKFQGFGDAAANGVLEDLDVSVLSRIVGRSIRVEEADQEELEASSAFGLKAIAFLHEIEENVNRAFCGKTYTLPKNVVPVDGLSYENLGGNFKEKTTLKSTLAFLNVKGGVETVQENAECPYMILSDRIYIKVGEMCLEVDEALTHVEIPKRAARPHCSLK